MAKWLVKTEANVYSIDDLKRDGVTLWDGVRNYQARNFLRDMKIGDEVLVYQSVQDPLGIVGIASVKRSSEPDPTQFDPNSEYFDAKASQTAPRWFCPALKFVRKFPQVIALTKLRNVPALEKMELLKRGSRLSVQPVAENEFDFIIHELAT